MITVERSEDFQLLNRIGTSKEIYEATRDDGSPARLLCKLPHVGYYLITKKDLMTVGFTAFWPKNAVTFDTHICFLPIAYGKTALEGFKLALHWMWENTTAERICGEIPECNKRALWFVRRCGVTQYGLNPNSFKRDGKLYDMVLMGISRP